MPYFLIEISYAGAGDRIENPNFEVAADTSRQAIKRLLCSPRVTAEGRTIHTIHCGTPEKESFTDAEWHRLEPELAPLIRIPKRTHAYKRTGAHEARCREQHEAARPRREAMQKARAEGMTLRKIGELYGISPQRVREILVGKQKPRPDPP